MNKIILLSVGLVIVAVVGFLVFGRKKPEQTQTQTATQPQTQTTEKTTQPTTAPTTKTLKAAEIKNAHSDFKFSGTIPAGWQAEAVTAIDSINLYDPEVSGESNLEKSQIFIRKFTANSFLTLSTVIIHKREELTVNDRPAVRYDIEKKSGVADFPNQPFWRSKRHIVTDVRVSDSNPSVFYVIAQRPDLDDKIYQQFLDSLQVVAKVSLVEPIAEFKSRITKKPFGIFITPETSPVQPEKFRGYHTAADVEYDDKTEEIPIRAIADGTVVMASTASGYGGVLVIRHGINDKDLAVIYGHLDPASLPKVGDRVSAGQRVGILGEGGTPETDGGRKHLHFGIRTDDTVNIKGYVQNKEELSNWIDPLEFY